MMLTKEFITRAIMDPTAIQTCAQMHDGSCDGKAMSQFGEGCKGLYKMYLLVHIIPILMFKRKKTMEKYNLIQYSPIKELSTVTLNFVKSMLFAGGYSMLARRIICLLTKYYKYDSGSSHLTQSLPTSAGSSLESP